MKGFLLFTGIYYYPGCGWDDFVGRYDNLEDAEKDGRAAINKGVGSHGIAEDWWQVVSLETMEIQAQGSAP